MRINKETWELHNLYDKCERTRVYRLGPGMRAISVCACGRAYTQPDLSDMSLRLKPRVKPWMLIPRAMAAATLKRYRRMLRETQHTHHGKYRYEAPQYNEDDPREER